MTDKIVGKNSKAPKKRRKRGPAKPVEPTEPVSVRLTKAERERLAQEAGSLPFSVHLRLKLVRDRSRRLRTPDHVHVDIAKLLSQLGTSNISANLEQLASAVRIGGLPVTPETERLLIDGVQAVLQMRTALILALGNRQ